MITKQVWSKAHTGIVVETKCRVRAKVMQLPAESFSHTIKNPGTLDPDITTRRVITELADLPNIGLYCIIYDEVDRIRKEE